MRQNESSKWQQLLPGRSRYRCVRYVLDKLWQNIYNMHKRYFIKFKSHFGWAKITLEAKLGTLCNFGGYIRELFQKFWGNIRENLITIRGPITSHIPNTDSEPDQSACMRTSPSKGLICNYMIYSTDLKIISTSQ